MTSSRWLRPIYLLRFTYIPSSTYLILRFTYVPSYLLPYTSFTYLSSCNLPTNPSLTYLLITYCSYLPRQSGDMKFKNLIKIVTFWGSSPLVRTWFIIVKVRNSIPYNIVTFMHARKLK